MHLDARGDISIFELCVYIPLFVVSVVICKRHGFKRSSGFIFTLILCVIRVIGACCQLATYNSPSRDLFEAVVILGSVGLTPLLLATLGLLIRCVDSIKDSSSSPFRTLHFRLLQMLITVSLILSVYGGTKSFSSDGSYTPQWMSKLAIIMCIIAYAAEALIAVYTLLLSQRPHSEKTILFSIIAALPLILVRLIYSTLGVVVHLHTFSLINGSVAAFAIMAVATEILVICIYLFAGWKSDVVRPAPGKYPTSYSRVAPPNYDSSSGEAMALREGMA